MDQWCLKFDIKNAQNGSWLEIIDHGKKTVQVYGENFPLQGECVVRLQTYEKDRPLYLRAKLQPDSGNTDASGNWEQNKMVQLVWRGYRVELVIDGVNVDEEWPIGSVFREPESFAGNAADGSLEIKSESSIVENLEFSPELPAEADEDIPFENAQYWSKEQGRINVGDCMPFYDGERFHLYYLKDRNGHQSKWGLGAHQYAHISTEDMVHWTEHPMAVPITHQWEGSICTGSVIKAGDLYYAFYAVRMSDRTSAKVSWAVSRDGIHFEKSEKYFSLHAPYETTSVRDPEVFFGADGRYHMLLTSSWLEAQPEERNGCLAHLVSDDLENWEELPPFLIPGYTDQPECSNYFEWNGWYYLIYSNYGYAKYRYSRKPFGPWIRPEKELLGSCLYRVPKTAAYHDNRRIAAGFLANAVDGDSYAGNAVFRELVQAEDGTLWTKPVPEMLPEFTQKMEFCPGKNGSDRPEGMFEENFLYREQCIRETDADFAFRISCKPENGNTTYGVTLKYDTGASWEIRLEPFREKVSIAPLHSNPYRESEKTMLYQVKGLEADVRMTVVCQKGILDVYLNDRDSLVCRLEKTENAEKCRIGCFTWNGETEFSLETP